MWSKSLDRRQSPKLEPVNGAVASGIRAHRNSQVSVTVIGDPLVGRVAREPQTRWRSYTTQGRVGTGGSVTLTPWTDGQCLRTRATVQSGGTFSVENLLILLTKTFHIEVRRTRLQSRRGYGWGRGRFKGPLTHTGVLTSQCPSSVLRTPTRDGEKTLSLCFGGGWARGDGRHLHGGTYSLSGWSLPPFFSLDRLPEVMLYS